MDVLHRLLINPVLNKEIRLRFRSFKSFLGVFFYLLVCGAASLAFIFMETSLSYDGFTATDSRNLFMVLSIGQLGLIIFMAPGLTAGAISGEREMQTLNILLTTQQSSTSIILSKLFSSVAYLVLLLLASLPLYSVVFLYGGVSPEMVFITFGFHLLAIFTIGSLGVMFSTLIQRTMVATITTYGVMLFLVVGTFVLFLLSFQFVMQQNAGGLSQGTSYLPFLALMFNPIAVLVSVFQPAIFNFVFQAAGTTLPLWQGFVAAYILIGICALFVSFNRLRPSMKVKTNSRKG